MQLAAQVVDVLLPLEVGENRSNRKSLALAARNGAAERREIVQLAEGAGERRLAALVGSGDDDDPLFSFEIVVVA